MLARVTIDPGASAVMPPATQPADEPLGLQLAPLARSCASGCGSTAARAAPRTRAPGSMRGDLILSLNGAGVERRKASSPCSQRAGKGATVALLVQRDGLREFLPLRVPR